MLTTAQPAPWDSPAILFLTAEQKLLLLPGGSVGPFFKNSFFFLSQCKHILAVYLSQAMDVTQQEAVSNRQMSMLLSGTEAT